MEHSKLVIYSYSRCSTCRRALAWLQDNKIDYELKDIIETPPDKEMLADAIQQLGDKKYVFNTSGLSYRALGASTVKAMSQTEAINALAADGKLIKRPFVVSSAGKVIVGFKHEVFTEIFLN